MSSPKEAEFAALVAGVRIEGVRQVEGVFQTRMDVEDVGPGELSITYASKLKRDGTLLVVHVKFAGDVALESEELKKSSDAASKFRAVFELRYELPERDFSVEVLQEFAQNNAVFNAWPYWREFAQSSSLRFGLPPVLMPIFRLGDGVPMIDADTVEPAAESSKASDSSH